MGPPQTLVAPTPMVPKAGCHTIAMVVSLHEELMDLCLCNDSQRQSAAQAKGDEGEDEDECLVVKQCLQSFHRFVTDTLLNDISQPDHSVLGPVQ